MSAREVQQALNDMEQIVANALSTATKRLSEMDRECDNMNAVIVPAWVLRALVDKIIYDQHFMALTGRDLVGDYWHDTPGHSHD